MNLDTSGRKIQSMILAGEDDRVLKRLYVDVFPKVRSYILKHSGTKEEAEDLFQDCVLIIYTKSSEQTLGEVDNIGGFMMQIIKNLWINRVKRKARQQYMDVLPEFSEELGLVEMLENEEKTKLIHWMLDQIGDKCRDLLLLSVFQKFSMEEIAVKLGYTSANAAKTNNYRCKEKLIQLIEKNPGLKISLKN
jgi:RNA polymerase sigma factor (sigma-70 family)